MSDKKMQINRRGLIKGMSIAGVGTALLAYQNCAPTVEFASKAASTGVDGQGGGDGGTVVQPPPNPDPNPGTICSRALSIYDAPSKLPMLPLPATAKITQVSATPAGEAADHNPNAKFYRVKFYDHATSTEKDQYLLTVDVGVSGGQLHMVGSPNSNNVNIVTDVYVLNPAQAANPLVAWKRFGGSDHSASAMFMLDPALVASKAKLQVISYCLMHGYFIQIVDLGLAPLEYSTAVAPWAANTAFGSANIYRPYVSVDATGGQGNVGIGHAPAFTSVTNGEVKVTLGSGAGKHGAASDFHYVAGGFLFDQSGNLLSAMSELSYAMAKNHELVFSKLDLQGRDVKALRVVVMDTFNGYFQSFRYI